MTFNAQSQARLTQASLQAVERLAIAPLAPERPRMVFIPGMPRAGSSVLSQMLGARALDPQPIPRSPKPAIALRRLLA